MKHYVIILGMPGAGKDTQADRLAKKFPSVIIKTGDIARELAQEDPDVARILDQGGLISDELINVRVAEKMAQAASDSLIIFDGFPRRVEQAQWLDTELGKEAAQVHVCYVEIRREPASRRLLGRQRADDKVDVIARRLDVFKRETTAVLDYYRQSHRLTIVDGEPTPDVIEASMHAIVSSWL